MPLKLVGFNFYFNNLLKSERYYKNIFKQQNFAILLILINNIGNVFQFYLTYVGHSAKFSQNYV